LLFISVISFGKVSSMYDNLVTQAVFKDDQKIQSRRYKFPIFKWPLNRLLPLF
jgi:hypothetical protein